MNRIDRLAAILIQLQSRRLVKAQDIADKFQISLRTVYRDVRALEEAGVPVIGEAGSGYRLMEGYKLPPVMFSQEEATALLTAAKLVESKTDAGISKHYAAALDKIRAILRYTDKGHLEDIDDHIAVMRPPSFQYEEERELHLQPILKAISNSQVLEIDYITVDQNESTNRKVEPVGIYHLGTHWHLVGWCQLRNDYRNFRTDRINRLRITDEKISKLHPPLQSFINRTCDEKEMHKVVIDVEPEILKYFGEQKYYNGFVKEEKIGDIVRLTFLTSSLMGFSRWYMIYGDRATIIEPEELNEMVAQTAQSILERLGRKSLTAKARGREVSPGMNA